MLEICPNCGSHKWDKVINQDFIHCPKCNFSWQFNKQPLFILTGCSGIGKTSTARNLLSRSSDFIVLEADLFYNSMPHETEQDYLKQVETLENISKDIMHCGKPILWTMTGNLDKLTDTYNHKFFSSFFCLALVCDEENLRNRMAVGRKITNEAWIKDSISYNNFFMTHNTIGDTHYETFNTSNKNLDEISEYVENWIKDKLT